MSRTPKDTRLGVFVNSDATRENDRYVFDDPIASARTHFLDALLRLNSAIVEELRKIARVNNSVDDDAALTEWSERWHLTDPWCREYARATIQLYRRYHTNPDTLCFDVDLSGEGELVTPTCAETFDPRLVDADRRMYADALANTLAKQGIPREAVEAALAKWYAQQAATQPGRQQQTGRAVSRPKPLVKKPEHFDLLAHHHLDPTFAALGRQVGKKRAAVEKAIKRLAAEIGLTLRPSPKGNLQIGNVGAASSRGRRLMREQRRLRANLRH